MNPLAIRNSAPWKQRHASVTALIAVALAVACGPSYTPPSASNPPAVRGAVEITASDGFIFSPANVTVSAGTTVRWVNTGSAPHTVTSGLSSRPADSPGTKFDHQLGRGTTFEFQFNEVGEQPFFCRFHESMGMKGVVTVTPSTADGGSASSGDLAGPGGSTGPGGGYGY